MEIVDLHSFRGDVFNWRLRCRRCGWEGLETDTRLDFSTVSSFSCAFINRHDDLEPGGYVTFNVRDPRGAVAFTHHYKIARCSRCKQPVSASVHRIDDRTAERDDACMVLARDSIGCVLRDGDGNAVWAARPARRPALARSMDGGVSYRGNGVYAFSLGRRRDADPFLDSPYFAAGGVQVAPPSTACEYCGQDPAPQGRPCPGCQHVNGPGRRCPSCGIKRAIGSATCPGCGTRMVDGERDPITIPTARPF